MSEWAAKRFWEKTSVEERDGAFVVLLDGRVVKTPSKTTLAVPTAALADAIAYEWQAQDEKIDPMTMPCTRSANSALDKVTPQHGEVAALIAAYGEDDLLCYRAQAPTELVDRQNEIWNPLLDWARDELHSPLIAVKGVMHTDQPATSVANLTAAVTSQNPFELAALHDLVSLSGSLIIGLAAQRAAFDLDDLWNWSRLDEEWQIEQWGRDEDADATAAIKQASFKHAYRFYDLQRIQ